ncbi:SAM-dependent methyltransferase [Streptomyces oryzae]|uniref:S-adenosyl-L-methionine-dependent methyltransferase n=1 Tax=Streptomyces oryzae TaxID=1434886 RepID=A0ABS3XD67_9ACTN|nr:SAM-dependent methyltransferase [Streptomyces oryzae]MBO8192982.1 SAM-dependent methyltransferase [Streptomyces oryzae]
MNPDHSDQQWDIVSGVGVTALAVAAGRAIETSRPDALVKDPYAAAFVAAAPAPLPFPVTMEELGERSELPELLGLMNEYLGVRSRVFDDFLTDAAQGGIRQVVILASGLDTRPFRLKWPRGTRCFELDQPLVLDFKLRVLDERGAAAACAQTPVPVDLREDWAAALEAAGFDASRPTAWLAEGLLPYLPPEAEERLFKEIDRLSASGSRAAVEYAHATNDVLRQELLRDGSAALGIDLPALLPDGDKRGIEEQLAALGWEYESRSVHESAQLHGRTLTSAPEALERMLHLFARRP